MGRLTCTNSDGNGGVCGADFSILGNLVASVLVTEDVIAEKHRGKNRLVAEKHPFRTPGTQQEYKSLLCTRCGKSVARRFPSKTVHTSSVNGELRVEEDDD